MDKSGVPLRGISDKKTKEDIPSFDCNSSNYLSFSWLLAKEVKPKSKPRFHSILILYILEACFSNSWANFYCFFNIIFDLFLYPPQSFSSPYPFYFIYIFGIPRLTVFYVLDSPSSWLSSFSSLFSSSSSSSLSSSFLISESLSFALSF